MFIVQATGWLGCQHKSQTDPDFGFGLDWKQFLKIFASIKRSSLLCRSSNDGWKKVLSDFHHADLNCDWNQIRQRYKNSQISYLSIESILHSNISEVVFCEIMINSQDIWRNDTLHNDILHKDTSKHSVRNDTLLNCTLLNDTLQIGILH